MGTRPRFPGTAALEENLRPVVANFVPRLEAFRLTMTYPLINQSRQVLFLVRRIRMPRSSAAFSRATESIRRRGSPRQASG